MAIRWNKSLSTGLDWQDEQHKELFKRIDDLLEAMHRNEARMVIDELFQFLNEYAVKHFDSEEKFMATRGGGGAVQHTAEHDQFREQLKELEALHKKQGASSYLVMRLQRWLHDWLIKHINEIDKQLGADISPSMK